MKRITLLGIIILGFITTNTNGQIINVPSDQASIQEGINAANEGDTVLVDEGTYYENIHYRGKAITVASKFILDGDTAHISRTIIDGSSPVYPDSASTVNLLACKDTTSILKGFTITGGKGTKDILPTNAFIVAGAGIVMDGGKIENNIVTGNSINSTYYTVGGGIANRPFYHSINVIIRGNHVHNNSVKSTEMAQGGGIYADSEKGVTIVENNVITNNTATCTGLFKANGGGIMMGTFFPWKSTLIVRNNLINENEIHCVASHGGGIFLTFSDLDAYPATNISQIQIYNNIIANNYSEEKGGGIAIWDQLNNSYGISGPTPLIYNNTIVDNTAKEGGGIYNFDMNALLMNNIISNNCTSTTWPEISLANLNYPQVLVNHGRFQSFNNNIRGGWSGEGNIDEDPGVDTVDFTLLETSPCIDQGIDSVKIDGHWCNAPVYDYYGNPRPNPFYNLVDMGAIEYNHFYFEEIIIEGAGECNLTIEVVVEGGTPPYTYYKDGEENEDEGNIFVDLCSGDYTISVMDDKGVTIDSSFNVTGIDKSIVNAESVFIYPNPTNKLLTIETEQPDAHSIEINSLSGQLIYRTEMEGSSMQMDLSPFSKGIYFVTVRSKEFVRTKKVVKL